MTIALKTLAAACALSATVLSAGAATAQTGGAAVCGSLENSYGPYDYRTKKDKLLIVDKFHFTPDVERLRAGRTTTVVGGDISYTLRASPNHVRALQAMARLALRGKTAKPKGSIYTVDCWFDRAMRFRPDDWAVRLTYGVYLHQTDRKDAALQMLQSAAKLGEDSGNFHYNIGLLYLDLGKYDLALSHAHRAYALGFNLPGLRTKLQAAGQWQDPPATK